MESSQWYAESHCANGLFEKHAACDCRSFKPWGSSSVLWSTSSYFAQIVQAPPLILFFIGYATCCSHEFTSSSPSTPAVRIFFRAYSQKMHNACEQNGNSALDQGGGHDCDARGHKMDRTTWARPRTTKPWQPENKMWDFLARLSIATCLFQTKELSQSRQKCLEKLFFLWSWIPRLTRQHLGEPFVPENNNFRRL